MGLAFIPFASSLISPKIVIAFRGTGLGWKASKFSREYRMRQKRLKRDRPSIDKSALMFGEPERTRDRRYLNLAPMMRCAACGKPAHVAAHIREGLSGGTGLKPSDKLIEWLCHEDHMTQESQPGAEWWYENVRKVPTTLSPDDWLEQVYKPQRIKAYDDWAARTKGFL